METLPGLAEDTHVTRTRIFDAHGHGDDGSPDMSEDSDVSEEVVGY